MALVHTRICFLAPNAYPFLGGESHMPIIGGAEVQAVTIAKGLVARGYQVSMICLDYGQDDIIEIDGIQVFRAFHPSAGLPGIRFFWPRLTGLFRAMKKAKADIYYQRAASALTGIVAVFCMLNGKKSIFAAASDPSLERNTSKIRDRHSRLMYEFGLKRVDRILVQNHEQARLCKRNFGRDSTLMPNLYELPSTRGSQSGNTILWVSMIRRVKQPWIFLDLAASCPELQFRMIGGPEIGDDSLYTAVEERARHIANLEFTGFVPLPEVEHYFDEAAIVVNTSESEGFPNAFLQAWARGTPTISFFDTGARIGNTPVGRVVGTAQQMTDVLKLLMDQDQQRAAEGIRCRQYYEANHKPEPILDLYEKIFAELLAT